MQCIEGPSASEEAGCSIVHHNHACGRGTQRYRNAAGSPFSLRHACTTFACLLTPLLTHARKNMLPVVLDRAKLHCDRLREPPPRAALGDPPRTTHHPLHTPLPHRRRGPRYHHYRVILLTFARRRADNQCKARQPAPNDRTRITPLHASTQASFCTPR